MGSPHLDSIIPTFLFPRHPPDLFLCDSTTLFLQDLSSRLLYLPGFSETLPQQVVPREVTGDGGAQGHEDDSVDRVLEANGAAEVGGEVPDEGGEQPDDQDADAEAGPAMAVLGGGHTGEQNLPEHRQEVHDVVKAGRQPLLPGSVLLLLLVPCGHTTQLGDTPVPPSSPTEPPFCSASRQSHSQMNYSPRIPCS